MRIVIDYQGAQSPANGKRGIGRYTRSLAKAMVRAAEDHEFVLVLNGLLSSSIDDCVADFQGLISPCNVHIWYPPTNDSAASTGSRRAREMLYEAILASLRPDVVWISSLFEGPNDATVTSIGAFASLRTAVTMYDLIPLIHSDSYLVNPVVKQWYSGKIEALRRADLWLAISESSRREGIEHLGLDPKRCINVSTAADEHFREITIPAEREADLRARFDLQKPYVMYTGGIDLRKNLEGLIRAFSMLPNHLRNEHQLAIVCSASQGDRQQLLDFARAQNLPDGAVIVTGYVSEDDLIALYNLCALFAFPSLHEGFGLPALEAMHCGAVVVAANTSSLPEVLNSDEALFDPLDLEAIAERIARGLTDCEFRTRRIEQGRQQAKNFSWDMSARRAIQGLELLQRAPIAQRFPPPPARPRLAYVSPLPPERSGVASYSAELLPALAMHYDIELITDAEDVQDPALSAFQRKSVAWFRQNPQFDRVLYHFGNSEFHQHMFELLAETPGVVVLHDFYLSGIQAHREFHGGKGLVWTHALYEGHGYHAVVERYEADQLAEVIFKYPCNFEVLAQAQGVIVHSPHSIDLATQWFGKTLARNWALIPHLRVPPEDPIEDRAAARRVLGLGKDDFLVCAFGLLGPTKLNHRLLDAWMRSHLSKDGRCRLVFVGENDTATPYGREMARRIQSLAGVASVEVTGWASNEQFQLYLAASDLAVQLRTQSRGETSGTVLDTMSRGVATIVNANGSMAYLPQDAVKMLPDDFTDEQLAAALDLYWQDPDGRREAGANALRHIGSVHAPAHCASAYHEAVERFAAMASTSRDGLVAAVGSGEPIDEHGNAGNESLAFAAATARALPPPAPQSQMFVDVSELVQRDSRSGIQRVVKSLLHVLLKSPPAGYRIEPVYAVDDALGYKYACEFTLGFLGCPGTSLTDAPIDARPGDVFVGLDLQPHLIPRQAEHFRQLRHLGVRVEFVVYDLLPIMLPQHFSKDAASVHERWLRTVAQNDGAICISHAVASELKDWMLQHTPQRLKEGFNIRAFHLGADLHNSNPTKGHPSEARQALKRFAAAPSFLMVGTVEPRKGHANVLDAFDQLWASGDDVNLVIVGKKGWMTDSLTGRLQSHPEKNRRLFWFQSASDEFLEQLYANCSCLIAASEGEGFGLPLIEGAMNHLPILAADLPVFREVAGDHAHYFVPHDGAALAASLREWLSLFAKRMHRRSDALPYLNWEQSAAAFTEAVLSRTPEASPSRASIPQNAAKLAPNLPESGPSVEINSETIGRSS